MTFDPRFPPVRLQSDLEAVDAPQYIPGSPHNLPATRDRPARRTFVGSFDAPTSGPFVAPVPTNIFDPHHYAKIIEGNGTIAISNVAQLIISINNTLRNFMMIRNSDAAAILFVSFGTPASAGSPLALTAGQIVLFDVVVPQDDVYVSSATAGATFSFSYSTIAS